MVGYPGGIILELAADLLPAKARAGLIPPYLSIEHIEGHALRVRNEVSDLRCSNASDPDPKAFEGIVPESFESLNYGERVRCCFSRFHLRSHGRRGADEAILDELLDRAVAGYDLLDMPVCDPLEALAFCRDKVVDRLPRDRSPLRARQEVDPLPRLPVLRSPQLACESRLLVFRNDLG